MILTVYLVKKFLKFLIISIVLSYSIFFIFSLLGSLGENLNFTVILHLSALNSLSIYSFIPSQLFILAICLFIINLKSKNELVIIKEYLHIYRLFFMILPILIIFIYVELNKEIFSGNINKIKSDIFKLNANVNSKIFVNNINDNKTYSIFKSSNQKSNKVDQFLSYEIQNKKIKDAVFSDNLYMNNSDLLTNGFMFYNKNEFEYKKSNTKLFKNFESFWNDNSKVVYQSKLNNIKSKYNYIFSIFFNILFYFCISMTLFSKNIVNKNLNLQKIFIIILFLFLYHSILPKITLGYFHYYFQIISLIVLIFSFFQLKKHE